MSIANHQAGPQALANGFARHVRRWAEEVGRLSDSASALNALVVAAKQLSLATSAGHVCIHLDALGEFIADHDAEGLRQILLASGVIGTDEFPASFPLILDTGNRLYLHRYFDYELRLVQRLQRACSGQGVAAITEPGKRALNQAFAANAERLAGRVDWQKVAAALALSGKLTIISGGPGTGKTTTVAAILAGLLAQDPGCRIALTAPTGKAAARLLEAIRRRGEHLPEDIKAGLPQASSTIHRLLGTSRHGGRFQHDRANPLSFDVLVVDEASMLDLALATCLLEAVPEHARIILIGDKDQLSAVESGAVFAELSADPALSASCIDHLAGLCGTSAALLSSALPESLHSHPAIANSVVWLIETFRFAAGSGVARIAADIRCGNAAAALECLASADEPGVRWVADGVPRLGEEALRAVIDGYAPYLAAVRSAAGVAELADIFGRFRVLAALREGARGVSGLNQLVGNQFRHALNHPLDPGEPSPWYPGRPVMVLRNDYVLKVFNGDIGIAMPDAAGELMVYFPDRESGFRQLLPRQLPEHDTAFAMTVHKAQGSEFDHILLMLPERADNNITRELLYTAVTRCREQVTLIGDAAVIDAGIRTSTQRYSGLGARLQMSDA